MRIIRWFFLCAGGAIMTAAGVSPEEATSNLAAWLDLLGVDVPSWLTSKSIDMYGIVIGAVMVLLSIMAIKGWGTNTTVHLTRPFLRTIDKNSVVKNIKLSDDEWAYRQRMELMALANVASGRAPTTVPISGEPENSYYHVLKEAVEDGRLKAKRTGILVDYGAEVEYDDFCQFADGGDIRWVQELHARWLSKHPETAPIAETEVPDDPYAYVPLSELIMRVAGHSWDTETAIGAIDTKRLEYTWNAAWTQIRDLARSGHLCISGRKQFPDADPAARSGPLEVIPADYWSNATIHPSESDWAIEVPDIMETSALGDPSGFIAYADLLVERKDAVQQMLESFYTRGIQLRDECGWRMKERNLRWTINVQSFLDQELPGFALRFSRATDEIPLANRQVESVMMNQRFKVFRELMESAES